MLPSKALLSFILTSLALVHGSPLQRSTSNFKATLDFSTRINADGPLNILEKDHARAQAYRNAGNLNKRSQPVDVDIMNTALVYAAQVGIGSPATNYSFLVSTASGNTWVVASYTATNTSHDTGNTFNFSYDPLSVTGEEWIDMVTLAPDLVVERQSIGVATPNVSASHLLSGLDGVLGLGPVELTHDTVSNTSEVPTVMNNLASQGTIPEEVLGVYFDPASGIDSTGRLTFGGYDSTVIVDSVDYVPLTTTPPASNYWGINQSISYGGNTILNMTAGILDTGFAFTFIASEAFSQYQAATGGIMDSQTGLLTITSEQYEHLEILTFNIAGLIYDFVPNAQIWPRSLNHMIGGNPDSIYLVICDIKGTSFEPGIDFVIGYTFFKRIYVVLDAINQQVGFASTAYTNSTTLN